MIAKIRSFKAKLQNVIIIFNFWLDEVEYCVSHAVIVSSLAGFQNLVYLEDRAFIFGKDNQHPNQVDCTGFQVQHHR